MPIDHEIDEQRGLAVIRAVGDVTREDDMRCFAGLLSDPLYRPGLRVLLDYRERSSVASAAEVRAVAADLKSLRDRLGEALCAVVVSTDVAFGMGRMVAALAEGTFVPLRIFREIGEAMQWLESEEPGAEA